MDFGTKAMKFFVLKNVLHNGNMRPGWITYDLLLASEIKKG